jgi:hypothetical protein
MICICNDCTKEAHSRNLCYSHYMVAYRMRSKRLIYAGIDDAIAQAIPEVYAKNRVCSKCDKPAHAKQLCKSHYVAALRKRNFGL